MDRNEAVLRELNLYPLWVRRDRPAPDVVEPAGAEELKATRPEPVTEYAAPAEEARKTSPERPDERSTADDIHAVPAANEFAPQTVETGWPGLRQQVRDCCACKLRAGCTQTVFGVGDERADWLFVGEGPGADEDIQGEPFVGQAGKLLDNMLQAIGLRRGKNVYIANIVKCRPPNNRNPDAEEIAACLPYLHRQIGLIKPRLIVALGKVASNALLGKEASLASLRGKVHDFKLPATESGSEQKQESSQPSPLPHQPTSSHRVGTIPLIVTYHPAYLLRSPSEKAKAWQDLCLATERMQKL